MVSGMRSPSSCDMTITNCPARAARAISGCLISSRYVTSEKSSRVTISKLDMPGVLLEICGRTARPATRDVRQCWSETSGIADTLRGCYAGVLPTESAGAPGGLICVSLWRERAPVSVRFAPAPRAAGAGVPFLAPARVSLRLRASRVTRPAPHPGPHPSADHHEAHRVRSDVCRDSAACRDRGRATGRQAARRALRDRPRHAQHVDPGHAGRRPRRDDDAGRDGRRPDQGALPRTVLDAAGRDPGGRPRHPAGQAMGKSLPLLPSAADDRRARRAGPERTPEKPKARMLVYWGCGDAIRPGQPKVADTQQMSLAQFGEALRGRSPPPGRARCAMRSCAGPTRVTPSRFRPPHRSSATSTFTAARRRTSGSPSARDRISSRRSKPPPRASSPARSPSPGSRSRMRRDTSCRRWATARAPAS